MLRKVTQKRKDTNLHSETDDQSIFWILWGQHCSNFSTSKNDRKSNSGKKNSKIQKIQNSSTSVSVAAAAVFSFSSSRNNLPISSSSLQSDIDDLSQYILVENISNESNSSNDDETTTKNNSDSAHSLSIVCCGQNWELQFSLDHLSKLQDFEGKKYNFLFSNS